MRFRVGGPDGEEEAVREGQPGDALRATAVWVHVTAQMSCKHGGAALLLKGPGVSQVARSRAPSVRCHVQVRRIRKERAIKKRKT